MYKQTFLKKTNIPQKPYYIV